MRASETKDTSAYMEWLYREYHGYMFRVAWQYAEDVHTVEDIVSDACVSIGNKVHVLRQLEGAALRAYIASSVRNTALNTRAVRLRMQKLFVPLDEQTEPDIADDMERRIELRLTLHEIYGAIRKLPENERLVLLLKYRMEWSNGRIAEYLGIGANSIRMYVKRGRAHLLQQLEKDEKQI